MKDSQTQERCPKTESGECMVAPRVITIHNLESQILSSRKAISKARSNGDVTDYTNLEKTIKSMVEGVERNQQVINVVACEKCPHRKQS